VIAVNYESARLTPFGTWSQRRTWPLVIADESHRLKSNSGAISRYVGRLGLVTRYRLALTGTPMPHSLLDVWAQYRFVDRTIYDPSYTSFRARYAEMGGYGNLEIKKWRDLDERARSSSQPPSRSGSKGSTCPNSKTRRSTVRSARRPPGSTGRWSAI
jgi:hypothetical protein